MVFPPCLNVWELDGTGREGLEWDGRNLFSGISSSCWPLLRVTPENIACDDADAEKPPFKWQPHLHLQSFLHSFSGQAPDKLIQTNCDAFRYRNIICVRGITPCVCELCVCSVHCDCTASMWSLHRVCASRMCTHMQCTRYLVAVDP